jgi:hypothetical protein
MKMRYHVFRKKMKYQGEHRWSFFFLYHSDNSFFLSLSLSLMAQEENLCNGHCVEAEGDGVVGVEGVGCCFVSTLGSFSRSPEAPRGVTFLH